MKRLALLLFCFIAGCLIGFGAGYILPVSVEGKWEQAEAEKKSESPDTAAKSV